MLVAEGEHFVIDAVGEDHRIPRQFQSGDGFSGAVVERICLHESSPLAPLANMTERIGFRPCLHPGINLWGNNFDLLASALALLLDPSPLLIDFLRAVEVVGAHQRSVGEATVVSNGDGPIGVELAKRKGGYRVAALAAHR
jgi:hypothetical protein